MNFAGSLRHVVTLENPGTPAPDGDGGFTSTWAALTPSPVRASIEPATTASLERLAAGTVVSSATQIVKTYYHAGITTKTRLSEGARVLQVVNVDSRLELNRTVLLCTEVVA